MKIQDPDVVEWFRAMLRSQSKDAQEETLSQQAELKRQHTLLSNQQSRLVDTRIAAEIDQETFARKQTELRDRLASITLQLEVADLSRSELADLAVKAFELPQTLSEKWLTADHTAMRRILNIVCLNRRLNGVSLSQQMKKPFDVLAEGLLVPSSRGDRRWTFRNDFTPTGLMRTAIAKSLDFTAADFWQMAKELASGA